MSHGRALGFWVVLLTASVGAAQNVRVWQDNAGDVSTVRRTDTGADGSLASVLNLPDLLEVRVSGWIPTDPATDWYTGADGAPGTYHILRVDIVFGGLVNPAGPLEAGIEYDSQRYGSNPLTGFLNFDLDADTDTGCRLSDEASFTNLGNISRFGCRPTGDLANRTPISACDFTISDAEFAILPQPERSGEDMRLSFCSCKTITLVSQTGDLDGVMDAGETFIMSSRYFEMASAYDDPAGFLGNGTFNPEWPLRFSHDVQADETTVSLVFPLDDTGWSMLHGQPGQGVDFDPDNSVSVLEVLNALTFPETVPPNSPIEICSIGWEGRDPNAYLDPTAWELSALFGTAYDTPEFEAFAWTDVGFGLIAADVNGDGIADASDRTAVYDEILATDGVPCFIGGFGYCAASGERCDADGTVDGIVTIQSFGPNFNLYDINYDGFVDATDLAFYDVCLSDWDGSGEIDVNDLLLFLDAWFIGAADVNNDQLVDVVDLLDFLTLYWSGC